MWAFKYHQKPSTASQGEYIWSSTGSSKSCGATSLFLAEEFPLRFDGHPLVTMCQLHILPMIPELRIATVCILVGGSFGIGTRLGSALSGRTEGH